MKGSAQVAWWIYFDYRLHPASVDSGFPPRARANTWMRSAAQPRIRSCFNVWIKGYRKEAILRDLRRVYESNNSQNHIDILWTSFMKYLSSYNIRVIHYKPSRDRGPTLGARVLPRAERALLESCHMRLHKIPRHALGDVQLLSPLNNGWTVLFQCLQVKIQTRMHAQAATG